MQIVKSTSFTDVGNVRTKNEDSIYASDAHGLWIVADGMGGHACGEIASQLAIDIVTESKATNTSLEKSIELAHQAILNQSKLNKEQKGMGTTIVAAEVVGKGFNLAWVGDSRIYVFDKVLQQLTDDHSFVQDMIFREILTQEEAETHEQRNLINRSLGMNKENVKVGTLSFRPKNSGILLLCSDGVSDYVNQQALNEIFKSSLDIDEIKTSINEAVLNTAAGDNFTFILVEFRLNRMTQIANRLNIFS